MTATTLQAAERYLGSLPNPTKIKEIFLDVSYYGPQGSHSQAVLIALIIAVMFIVIAAMIAVVNS